MYTTIMKPFHYTIRMHNRTTFGGAPMLSITDFLTRHAFNAFSSFSAFILLVVNYDLGFFVPIITIAVYFLSNQLIYTIQKIKKRKQLQLTRSEYMLIEQQLRQAKQQLNKLNQQYVRVRSVKALKLVNDIQKLAKRIVHLVQANPQKFFVIEDFFYAHLPSAVELMDKYTSLTKEQLKDADVQQTLAQTRHTVKELYETMEDDLKRALQPDIDHLKIELDFAKLENTRRRQGGGHE